MNEIIKNSISSLTDSQAIPEAMPSLYKAGFFSHYLVRRGGCTLGDQEDSMYHSNTCASLCRRIYHSFGDYFLVSTRTEWLLNSTDPS